MQSSGDVVTLHLGRPEGREAGYLHPAVVVTARRILDAAPSVIQVVPLTSTLRGFHTEVVIDPDPTNGLEQSSAAQCQHVRAVSPARVVDTLGELVLRWWHRPSLSQESRTKDAVVRNLAAVMPAEGITLPAPELLITDTTQAD